MFESEVADMRLEIAHAMLKPETLRSDLRDIVIRELSKGDCEIVASRRLTLSLEQIATVYSHFSNLRAKPVIFNYFTSNETEHLALVGPVGLHNRLDEIKGQTGTDKGIRGKYYTKYTRLSEAELQKWLKGTLANAEDIDLEMFGRDIVHVSDTEPESIADLRVILLPAQLEAIRARGVAI